MPIKDRNLKPGTKLVAKYTSRSTPAKSWRGGREAPLPLAGRTGVQESSGAGMA